MKQKKGTNWNVEIIKSWDKWSICIDFNNSLIITYQSIRDHLYPYLEQWITDISWINCNEIQSKKVEEIITEFNNK